MSNKTSKTPIANRSVRKISCLADIESRTPRTPNRKSRKSFAGEECDESMEESLSEITLPWSLSDMTEQEIIELTHSLENEILDKETDYPKMAANNMKTIFDKQMEFLREMLVQSENRLNNCLKQIGLKSGDGSDDGSDDRSGDNQRIDFNETIGKQFNSIKDKSEELKKLLSDLSLIQEISKN